MTVPELINELTQWKKRLEMIDHDLLVHITDEMDQILWRAYVEEAADNGKRK